MKDSDSARPVILFAEDEGEVRDMMVLWLEKQSYSVVAVEHGGEARRVLESGQQVDVLLTDLSMPVMDGTELLAWLRDSQFAGVPAVIYTGDAQASVPGVRRVLKTATPEELLEAVREAARNRAPPTDR